MKKVELTSEEAKAVEWARGVDRSNSEIIDRVMNVNNLYHGPNTAALRAIPFDTLLQALVNGYTVMKSKEERMREGIDAIHEAWRIAKPTKPYDANRERLELLYRVADYAIKFNAGEE